jgi:NADH-quinone oxidoreductase subunit A
VYVPASFESILLLGALALGLGLVILFLTVVLGPRVPSPVKQSTYESGLVPIGPAQRRMPVRFYLVAVLFILFDIEAIYLFPWAVQFRQLAAPAPDGLGYGALVSMAVFLGVLAVGFVYVWRKGALEWG